LKNSETSYSLVIYKFFKKQIIKKLEVVEKNLRNKREKITTQEISNSRRRTQIIERK
jgi:hypothetical protein